MAQIKAGPSSAVRNLWAKGVVSLNGLTVDKARDQGTDRIEGVVGALEEVEPCHVEEEVLILRRELREKNAVFVTKKVGFTFV